MAKTGKKLLYNSEYFDYDLMLASCYNAQHFDIQRKRRNIKKCSTAYLRIKIMGVRERYLLINPVGL